MMYWIYDYSNWAIGSLFCAVFVAVTWIGIFLMRATIHSWIHRDTRTNEMIGIALSSFFVLFGLLLGLLAVATYQNFSTVSDIVDKEAASSAALYTDVSGYPQPLRDQLQNDLREYVRFTMEDGWQLQQHGIVPRDDNRIASIRQALFAFETSKENEKVLQVEAVRQFNNFIEHRRSRLAAVNTGLPSVLWRVVAFGALLNIVLIWIQDMEIHVHLILGGILASILGAVIFLIAALDNPFRGQVSVSPEPFTLVYTTVMNLEPAPTLPISTSPMRQKTSGIY